MARLTVRIDDAVLRSARDRARAEGTSVGALVRSYLERYGRDEDRRAALRELVALARETAASSGEAGRSWTRAELHRR